MPNRTEPLVALRGATVNLIEPPPESWERPMARGPGPPIGLASLGDGPRCPDTTLLPLPTFDVQISATSIGPGGLRVAAGNVSSRFPWPFRCSPLHLSVWLVRYITRGLYTVAIAHPSGAGKCSCDLESLWKSSSRLTARHPRGLCNF